MPPPDAVRCVLVEAVNVREWDEPIPEDERCDNPECSQCIDGVKSMYLCDVRRVDMDEILSADQTWFPGGNLPAGAMYFIELDNGGLDIRPGGYIFAPGAHLHVELPNGGAWNIDSRASNCGLPDDTEHRCWVREGEPPDVSVTKAGNTCAAGAGSIQSGNYHGWLENGWLVIHQGDSLK